MTTMTVQNHAGDCLHSEFAGADSRPDSPIFGIVGRAIATVREWQTRAEQRAHLLELDQHLLDDVGLTRADVLSEASKPF